ncbi:hypothetical protein AB0A69_16015 [Streptomyces sp. NPDC045431]|uniref:hypothetical protein n=1 Tax=Streptomyces sp. NPDC045431 TaxID=3155613 RepID=UPI0033C4E5D9
MTAAAAVPVAALRLVRGAARRHAPRHHTLGARALTAALFLGGLLALGFLCGGQAYAAEPTPGAAPGTQVTHATHATHVTQAPAERLRAAEPETAAPRATEAVREAADRTAIAAEAPDAAEAADAAQAVESVGGAVAVATGAVRDLGSGLTRALPAGPVERPSAPGLPGLPVAPELPQAPAPAEAESPGVRTVAGTATTTTGAGARTGSAAPAASHADTATLASAERIPAYGEDHWAITPTTLATPATAVALPASPPAAPEPCSGGVCLPTAGVGAGDGGSPRGADQHAAQSASVPYPAPVRGAGLPATVAPVHDRPHDILEFPG